MSKATEAALSALHGQLATVLNEQLSQEAPETTFNAEGEMVETGNMILSASPATIAQARQFLKDNSITCDIESSDNMSNLREKLANKQKNSRLGSAKEASTVVEMVDYGR